MTSWGTDCKSAPAAIVLISAPAGLNGVAGQVNNSGKLEHFFQYSKLNYHLKFNEFRTQKINDRKITSNNELYDNIFKFFEKANDDENFINMSYAWESIENKQNLFRGLSEIAKKTEILVIIGYSFPFVNRDIDIKFFSNLDQIQKVYIQNPSFNQGDKDLLYDRYEILRKKQNIEIINQTKEFFIPNEFDH